MISQTSLRSLIFPSRRLNPDIDFFSSIMALKDRVDQKVDRGHGLIDAVREASRWGIHSHRSGNKEKEIYTCTV